MQKLPRGVRNNNPGNIDYIPKNKWQGQTGIEEGVPKPRFARFDRPENGIRAIAKLLLNYHKAGFNTVAKMINRWAPPVENDTGAYARAVASEMGLSPFTPFNFTPVLLAIMVRAIVKHENGYDPYAASVYDDGIQRAL